MTLEVDEKGRAMSGLFHPDLDPGVADDYPLNRFSTNIGSPTWVIQSVCTELRRDYGVEMSSVISRMSVLKRLKVRPNNLGSRSITPKEKVNDDNS
jgi:hypothetical protein